jgi:uncharacterized membrane protein
MTKASKEEEKKDSLKELEKLLEKDVMAAKDDERRLIPKKESIGIMIRLSAFIILALILYFARIFDSFVIVLIAIAIFVMIEGFNVSKLIKSRRKSVPSFDIKE